MQRSTARQASKTATDKACIITAQGCSARETRGSEFLCALVTQETPAAIGGASRPSGFLKVQHVLAAIDVCHVEGSECAHRVHILFPASIARNLFSAQNVGSGQDLASNLALNHAASLNANVVGNIMLFIHLQEHMCHCHLYLIASRLNEGTLIIIPLASRRCR